MADETGIKHVLALKLLELEQRACIDNVPLDDVSRVDEVALRVLEETSNRLTITIKHTNPLRPEAASDVSQASSSEATRVFAGWPERIGKQMVSTIQGVLELKADFGRSREDPAEADRITQLVLARMKFAIQSGVGLRTLVDSFGEECVDFAVLGGSEYDSGSSTSNISRYFLRWAAVTLTAAAPGF